MFNVKPNGCQRRKLATASQQGKSVEALDKRSRQRLELQDQFPWIIEELAEPFFLRTPSSCWVEKRALREIPEDDT